MTNDLNGGELSIQKCPKCRDGYLVVKQGVSEPILGCTNYKHDKTGCDCLMSKDYYKRWRNSGFEDDLSIDKPSFLNGIEQKMPKVIRQKPAQQKNTNPAKPHQPAPPTPTQAQNQNQNQNPPKPNNPTTPATKQTTTPPKPAKANPPQANKTTT